MKPEAYEESLVLQGMGSLHHQHLELLSAFTGGIGSVVLKRSGKSWTGLCLQCPELQCDLFLAVQRIFSAVLDMKLTFPADCSPVLSLSCVVWLHDCFLLGCLESL